MIDRNKLIKGLECCTEPSRKCSECPYVGEGKTISYCATRLTKDTLALLKADQLEMIRLRDRIETLERIVDHMKDSINESLQYLKILAMRR